VTCPPGQECSGGRCYPSECSLESCPGHDEICVDGVCVARSCANVDCGALACANGWCLPADCQDLDCVDGLEVCFEGACVPRSCAGVSCQPSEGCAAGECYPLACGADPCGDGEVCAGGVCLPRLCVGVACEAWQRCELGTCCPRETCSEALQCAQRDCTWGTFRCLYDASLPRTRVDHGALGCTDADACTTGDTCIDGECQGAALDCDDDNPCTRDGCDPATGQCQNLADDEAACSDGDGCTTGDHCEGGHCVSTGGSSCDDGNPCTDDGCIAGTGECTHEPNTAPCSDSNACTQGEVCAAGACQPGTPVTCDDQNPCTTDSCNPATGCVFAPNADACDDGDACTVNDACTGGICAGAPRSCDDGNPCTTNGCDPATGCTSVHNTAACDDGDACTAPDRCADGACQGALIDADGDTHQPPPCGNDCRDDNPDVHPGAAEGPLGSATCSDGLDNDCDGTTDGTDSTCQSCTEAAQCDDHNACNGVEGCAPPNCTPGTPLDCDDGNPCTTDSCDPAAGCQHANLPNGTECGARACSGLEWRVPTCQSGQCTGSTLLENCADANQCTADACSAATGCSHPSAPNGTECGARSCSGLDWRMQTCHSGACTGNALVLSCDDGNTCTGDTCDAATGCSNPAVTNGTECGARYCNGL